MFAIEYWPLEFLQLTLRPPDRELPGESLSSPAGHRASGGDGVSPGGRGAHAVIADLNVSGAETVAAEIVKKQGRSAGWPSPAM